METKKLNQAVKRNQDRFPEDFMFRRSADEEELLRSQSVTSKPRGGTRFAEHEKQLHVVFEVIRQLIDDCLLAHL